MKRLKRFAAAGAFLLLVLPGFVLADAPGPAQERALEKRAQQVKAIKNRFVTRALAAHGIDYQLNQEGDVSMIMVDGGWRGVSQVEVVPNLLKRWGKTVVVGHTLYFLTDAGWLSVYMSGTAW